MKKFIVLLFILFLSSLPSHAQTTPPSITVTSPTSPPSAPVTIQPPVGLPTHVYPGANGGPATVVPPVGLPTFIYGR